MNCSFIIPAYNEEAYLPKTIESLRQSILQSGIIETGEIIVVDNDSTDQTAEIAKELGVTVVKEPMRQIARARNSGAWHAKGEILFFIDADTDVASEHISQAYNLMVQKKAFGGGALIRFDDHQNKFFLGILIPSFWNWLSRTLKMAAGSFLYCRKQDFHEIGGFPEKMYAGEELGFVRKLKKLNRHSSEKFHILENPPVITSSRKLKWYGNMQMAFYLALLFVFPLAVRFQKLCGFWYNRPHK